MANFYLSHHWI